MNGRRRLPVRFRGRSRRLHCLFRHLPFHGGCRGVCRLQRRRSRFLCRPCPSHLLPTTSKRELQAEPLQEPAETEVERPRRARRSRSRRPDPQAPASASLRATPAPAPISPHRTLLRRTSLRNMLRFPRLASANGKRRGTSCPLNSRRERPPPTGRPEDSPRTPPRRSRGPAREGMPRSASRNPARPCRPRDHDRPKTPVDRPPGSRRRNGHSRQPPFAPRSESHISCGRASSGANSPRLPEGEPCPRLPVRPTVVS